ncbi:MAG: M23 family metallopeptidase [Planctomycetes bacterium]|nr:M23 family metallopeptidase [Planctomycetota bacterium]
MFPRPALVAIALIAFVPAVARAHDPVMELSLRPSFGAYVSQPAHLEVRLSWDGDAFDPRWLVSSTLAVRIDAVDVTAAFLQRVLAADAVSVTRGGAEVLLRDPLELPLGDHSFEVELRNVFGYVYRARGGCFVLPALVAPRVPENVPPAPVDTVPPVVELDPHHYGFVDTETPLLIARLVDDVEGVDPGTLVFTLDGVDILPLATRTRDGLQYQVPQQQPLDNGRHVLFVQAADRAGNVARASATFVVFERADKHSWFFAPVNQSHPFAHTHHQFQLYSSNPASAYFHHGIDIREPAQTPVLACAGGVVENAGYYSNPPYYYEVAIRDADGFLWEYHHIDAPTVPAGVLQAFQTGGSIPAGTFIGETISWPVRAYGALFHHIHMNVKDEDGRYINPLHLILDLADATPPSCLGVWVLPNEGTSTFAGSPPVVSGDVDVVARFEDRVAPEPYQLTLYETEVEIHPLGGVQAPVFGPRVLWRFDNLPGGTSRFDQIWDVFKMSFQDGATAHSTQGDYNDRRFYYTLTNATDFLPDGPAGYWDTDATRPGGLRTYPNGLYRITVRARDIRGNEVSRTLDVRVQN